MMDFEQEVECYLGVSNLISLLEKQELTNEPIQNMKNMYSSLEKGGIISNAEVQMCNAWLDDCVMLSV